MTYKVSAVDVGTVKLNEQDTVSSVLQNIAILLSTRQGTVPLYGSLACPCASSISPPISPGP